MIVRWVMFGCLLLIPLSASAGEPKKREDKKPPEAALVPFRLTDTQHTLVRVKINGKGPYNFIVDTGCPVFLIAEPIGKKAGLKVEKGWAVLDKLELEGGLQLSKVKARVETPFQITGMNGMGLAGVELHGMMGYTVLAKYKIEYDYTKKHMAWTPLPFDPPPPMPLGKKVPTGGIDFMSAMVQLMTAFAGIGPPPPPQPRGFFGFELEQVANQVRVAHVLPASPAAAAGLKKGDLILEAHGSEIRSVSDLLQQASKITEGKTLSLTIERGKAKQELKITAGEGL
jgi:serine protease DegQ